MTTIRIAAVVGISAAIAASIVAGFIIGHSRGESLQGAAADKAAPVVKTEFPGLVAPTGDPELPSLARLAPEAGTVALAEGPFDDRFHVNDLVFDGTSVSGSILIDSDVSEVINLEVIAGFYDISGALIGDGRFVLESNHGSPHASSGAPRESLTFQISVPVANVGRAVSVAVGVPVLVNE
jgi:hypothetical protein